MIAPWYAMAYVKLDRIAARYGYALALHGSMSRDLDLIAVPWTSDAESPDKLLKAIMRFIVEKSNVQMKRIPPVKNNPHGRLSYSISIGFEGNHYLDLSIMPRKRKQRSLK